MHPSDVQDEIFGNFDLPREFQLFRRLSGNFHDLLYQTPPPRSERDPTCCTTTCCKPTRLVVATRSQLGGAQPGYSCPNLGACPGFVLQRDSRRIPCPAPWTPPPGPLHTLAGPDTYATISAVWCNGQGRIGVACHLATARSKMTGIHTWIWAQRGRIRGGSATD